MSSQKTTFTKQNKPIKASTGALLCLPRYYLSSRS